MSYDLPLLPVVCACGRKSYDPQSIHGMLVCVDCAREINDEAIPAGFRRMTEAEADAYDGSQSLLVFDCASRCISRWFAASYSGQWGWKVVQRTDRGEVAESLRFAPDKGGMDAEQGRYVVVVPIDVDDLAPLLAQSIYALEDKDILNEVRDARANMRVV